MEEQIGVAKVQLANMERGMTAIVKPNSRQHTPVRPKDRGGR